MVDLFLKNKIKKCKEEKLFHLQNVYIKIQQKDKRKYNNKIVSRILYTLLLFSLNRKFPEKKKNLHPYD